uniref:Uncharacterized protein n=1 Tax=Oryza nivara TaxID=4536 RepID=A0A0E0H8L0_ORYNI
MSPQETECSWDAGSGTGTLILSFNCSDSKKPRLICFAEGKQPHDARALQPWRAPPCSRCSTANLAAGDLRYASSSSSYHPLPIKSGHFAPGDPFPRIRACLILSFHTEN